MPTDTSWRNAPNEKFRIGGKFPAVLPQALLEFNIRKIDALITAAKQGGVASPVIRLIFRVEPRDGEARMFTDLVCEPLADVLTARTDPDFAIAMLQIDDSNVPVLLESSEDFQICWRKA